MKAAVLYELNRPLVLKDEILLPKLTHGQVLVRIAYSGVCHSQLMEVRGRRGEDKYLPHLLGHEGSGIVIDVGSGVTKVSAGDKVILGWIKGSGIDTGGCQYICHGEIINAGSVTTFSEYAIVSENRCVLIPEGVPIDVAALLGCAVLTGAGIVTHTICPRAGSVAAIFGLGGIGLSALMTLKLFDCKSIIAVDVSMDKLKLAMDFGATHVVDASKNDPVHTIRELTSGQGADYSIEAAGRTDTIEQAFDAVKRGGGLCVFASHPAYGKRISIDPFELICGKQLKGSWGGASDPDRDIPLFGRLFREGKLPLDKLITKRYKLETINEALDDLECNRVGRPLIEIEAVSNCI